MRHLIARAEISTKMTVGSHVDTLRDADIAFLTTRITALLVQQTFVYTCGYKLTNSPIRELHFAKQVTY